MLVLIGQICAVLAAVAGLLTILYKAYWCPKAKARRKAVKSGQEAAEKLDPSGVTSAFDRLRNKK